MKDITHVHLDFFGGVAGDMFISSILDAAPEYFDPMKAELKCLFDHIGVEVLLQPYKDNFHITGSQFKVVTKSIGNDSRKFESRRYEDILELISSSVGDQDICKIAFDIFELIARAESKVHGIEISKVAFHEIGAWDSIADVMCASYLLHKFRSCTWSLSAVPLGGGTVKIAHGTVFVPAPATVELLSGIPVIYGGSAIGERTTPTGAAVVKYLSNRKSLVDSPKSIVSQGRGFGEKTFREFSNHLRSIFFSDINSESSERIYVIEFEVDDQTAEDLAVAIAKLVSSGSVIDVSQMAVFGKKGRMAAKLQVLCHVHKLDEAVRQCFIQTTTIGLRYYEVQRRILSRREEVCVLNEKNYNVKAVERPDGVESFKVESDDLSFVSTQSERASIRQKLLAIISKRND